MPRVVRTESPAGELLLEDEVARPGVGLEVEPAPRVEGVGAAQEEARVVVQAGEYARIVVAIGLGNRERNGGFVNPSEVKLFRGSRDGIGATRTGTSQMTAQTWTG